MRKILFFGIVLSTLLPSFMSCSRGTNGELVGVSRRGKYFEPIPFGMSKIPRGSFTMGPSDQDVAFSHAPNKTVDVDAFWMDDHEITNNEYRQFVYWVRDSIARRLLGDSNPDFLITEDEEGNIIDPPKLNWYEELDYNDPDNADALEELYYHEKDRFFNERQLNPRKLNFEYAWIDLKQAARSSNRFNHKTQSYDGVVFDIDGQEVPIEGRSSFIMRESTLIYPDTLCWIRDYTYSYNEPWATTYFYHPGFDDYPVVGVTWKQAKAFCSWRTLYMNGALKERGDFAVQDYRLPSEAEWEYAARGGLRFSMYPWGGVYTKTHDGCFMANFKPNRGNYSHDLGLATINVGTYDPNGYGLYDMAGNVAEWTNTAYDEAAYNFQHDMNPNYEYNALPDDPPALKRKVVRGGSWKDIAYFLRVGTRTFEYQDTAKSYVGFRCVRSSFGDEF